jgi:hypothetical protein
MVHRASERILKVKTRLLERSARVPTRIHKQSALGSAAFRPPQREPANEFGIFCKTRGAGDIEAR